MRTLKFIVDKQIITRDPECDFTGLVPGSAGYLQAEFMFSPEWDDCIKVAGFYDVRGNEYPPQLLKDGKTCMFPAEVLKRAHIKINLIGKKKDYKINTNYIDIHQTGGKI